MNIVKRSSWILCWSATAGIAAGHLAAAQETVPPTAPARTPAASAKPAPQSSAQSDAGEPRANTSPTPPGASSSSQAASGAAPPDPAVTASQPAARASKSKTPGQKPAAAVDRLELNTATVTGDREQPKVMYIVPWKSSDVGDLSGKPMNSLLDEALAPVDRDVFKREVAYYNAVKADGSQNGTSGGAAKQGEK